jgi:hypothetical protein
VSQCQSRTLAIETWTRLAAIPPRKPGYYRVRDHECREGIAFLNPNQTWTSISGEAQKPYADWSDVR